MAPGWLEVTYFLVSDVGVENLGLQSFNRICFRHIFLVYGKGFVALIHLY